MVFAICQIYGTRPPLDNLRESLTFGMTSTPPSTPEGSVQTSITDGVGTVSFHHPKGNSLPGRLLNELAGAVRELGEDSAARVIVMRSEGTGPFCAGASFDELVAIQDLDSGQQFFSGFAKVILAMIRAPKFVLTRVHGKTAGGGVGLVAASDYSLALKTASAKLSELAVGIGPFVVGPVIEKKIGLAAFSAMTVDADWRDAAWCERQALYSRVFDDLAALDAGVDALAKTLAASNPEAMELLKQVFWEGTRSWDTLLNTRAGMSGRLVLSDFTRNAIGSFKAK